MSCRKPVERNIKAILAGKKYQDMKKYNISFRNWSISVMILTELQKRDNPRRRELIEISKICKVSFQTVWVYNRELRRINERPLAI